MISIAARSIWFRLRSCHNWGSTTLQLAIYELQHVLQYIVMNKLFGDKQLILVFLYLFSVALAQNITGVTTATTMVAAGRNAPLAPHMRPGAPRQCIEWMGDIPPSLRVYFLRGSWVFIDLKALLCSGDDELPQHWSLLRTINTLNSPKSYIHLLGVLLPIHSTHRRGTKGLVWGTRGPFLPVAAMVGYGCDG
jgi:hypothetical protein